VLVDKLKPLKARILADTADDRLAGHVADILAQIKDDDALTGVAATVGADIHCRLPAAGYTESTAGLPASDAS
jgi:hypothetical protein